MVRSLVSLYLAVPGAQRARGPTWKPSGRERWAVFTWQLYLGSPEAPWHRFHDEIIEELCSHEWSSDGGCPRGHLFRNALSLWPGQLVTLALCQRRDKAAPWCGMPFWWGWTYAAGRTPGMLSVWASVHLRVSAVCSRHTFPPAAGGAVCRKECVFVVCCEQSSIWGPLRSNWLIMLWNPFCFYFLWPTSVGIQMWSGLPWGSPSSFQGVHKVKLYITWRSTQSTR